MDEIEIKAIRMGASLRARTAFWKMDDYMIVAQFWNRDWRVGVWVYLDAHESIWTQTYADNARALQQTPKQHDSIDAAIRHARAVVAV